MAQGTKLTCISYPDLLFYVFLVLQLIVGTDCLIAGTDGIVDGASATNECDGFNLAILSGHQVRHANTSEFDFALGPSARK
jgi:hypothetical protein